VALPGAEKAETPQGSDEQTGSPNRKRALILYSQFLNDRHASDGAASIHKLDQGPADKARRARSAEEAAARKSAKCATS